MRGTLTDEITCVLREEVLRGQYRPGERLPSERDLAARFDTTRGVVRVALKKLEQLGVAEVHQGGARVQPLSEASLDVVGHLLELDGPPDVDLVDQIIETVGALAAASARRLVERGSEAQRAEARALLAEIRRPECADDVRHELVHRLGHLVIEAAENLVMRIVIRSLRTELLAQLQRRGVPVEVDGVDPGRAGLLDLSGLVRAAERFSEALEQEDGLAGYVAATEMWGVFRKNIHDVLARAEGAEPQAAAS